MCSHNEAHLVIQNIWGARAVEKVSSASALAACVCLFIKHCFTGNTDFEYGQGYNIFSNNSPQVPAPMVEHMSPFSMSYNVATLSRNRNTEFGGSMGSGGFRLSIEGPQG